MKDGEGGAGADEDTAEELGRHCRSRGASRLRGGRPGA